MAGAFEWGLGGEVWRKGPWTAEEDKLLIEYVYLHGEGRWNSVAKITGLKRNGKSCRLRFVNYLRPDLKKGQITPEEKSLILELHAKWGNRWSTIARSLPGRTDNEIKNYWRTHFKKTGKPSKAGEKAKSRAMRRQEQWKLLQQQREPHIETALDDMPRMDDIPVTIPQAIPETLLMNHTSLDTCLSPLYNEEVPVLEGSSEEELLLWNGLWNLDDFDMWPTSESFL